MTAVAIVLAPGAGDNGFAAMLAMLLRQNLDDHEDKRVVFGRMVGRVALVATDTDQCITLLFEAGRLTIHDGIVGIPDVTVRAASDAHMKMSLVELTARGLPDPKGEVAREVFKASLDGTVVVYGALSNLPLLARLTRVMSVV